MDERNRGQTKANFHIIKRASMAFKGKPPEKLLGNIAGYKPVLFKSLNELSLLNNVLRAIQKRGDKNALAFMTEKTVFMQTLNRPSAKFETPASNANNSAQNNDTDSDNDYHAPAIDLKKYGTLAHMKIIRRENALRHKRLREINKAIVPTLESVNNLADTRGSPFDKERRYKNAIDNGPRNSSKHSSRPLVNETKVYSTKRCHSLETLLQSSEPASSLSSVIITPYEKRSSEQRNHRQNVQVKSSRGSFEVYPQENDQVHTEQKTSNESCLPSISANANGDSYSLLGELDESDFGDNVNEYTAADTIQQTERSIKQRTDIDVRKISYRRLASCLFMPFCRRFRLEIFVADEENECLTPLLRASESKIRAEASLAKITSGNETRSNENQIQENETQSLTNCFDVNTAHLRNTHEVFESRLSSNRIGNTRIDYEKDNLDAEDHAGRTTDSNMQPADEPDISDSEIETHERVRFFDVYPKKYGSLQHMKQIRKQNRMMHMRLQSVTHRKNNYVNQRGTSPERVYRNRLRSAKKRTSVADNVAILHHGESTISNTKQRGFAPNRDVINSDSAMARDSGEQIIPANQIIEKTHARIKSSKPKNADALCPSQSMNSSNKKHQSSSPKTLLRQRIKSAKQYGSVAHYQKVREVNASIKSRVLNAATKLQTWQPVEKMESLTCNRSSQLGEGATAGKPNLKSWQLPSSQTSLKATTSWNGTKRHDQKDHSRGPSETDENKDRKTRARPNVTAGLRETNKERR